MKSTAFQIGVNESVIPMLIETASCGGDVFFLGDVEFGFEV